MAGLLSGVLVMLAAQAQPGDWVEVAQHEAGPIFLDRASIRREGHIVTLRSRTVFNQAQEDGTKTLLVRFRYDCGARTSDLMSFSSLREDGTVILSEDVPADQRQVEPIPPGSPNAAIAEQVCGAPAG